MSCRPCSGIGVESPSRQLGSFKTMSVMASLALREAKREGVCEARANKGTAEKGLYVQRNNAPTEANAVTH